MLDGKKGTWSVAMEHNYLSYGRVEIAPVTVFRIM
jgi:hypothetical protein